MLQKIHSQDSNFDKKSDLEISIDAYKEAAAMDDFLFGDYDYLKTWNNQESNDVY
jgi:hypothetical protein